MSTTRPRSVLVTGCSTGFGLEIALYLAERGFAVYATMRDLARGDRLRQEAECRKVAVRVLRLDVTDQASIDEVVRTMVAETGGVYGVVNNAGQILRGYFEDLSDAEIRAVFDTNVFGMMAVTRAVLPHMRTARRGRVVIITSVAGKIGAPSGSAYSATRFAQEGFAESLSQEMEPFGVKVALIEPGITKSESWTIDRGGAVAARDPNSPYYAAFREAERLFDRAMHTSGIELADIARAVYRALTEPRPRYRYVVGRRAAAVLALRRHIPGEVFDRFYFKQVMRRVNRAQPH